MRLPGVSRHYNVAAYWAKNKPVVIYHLPGGTAGVRQSPGTCIQLSPVFFILFVTFITAARSTPNSTFSHSITGHKEFEPSMYNNVLCKAKYLAL